MTESITKSKAILDGDAMRNPPRAVLNADADDVLHIVVSGDYGRILAAVGHATVSDGLVSQLANLRSQRRNIDAGATDFALGFVDSMKPNDAAEALLVAQMAAIHNAAMMLARRLNHVENIPQQDAAERALNKLARTFTAQMDMLKRYRSKGQQVVRVERVTVEPGAQAVVGNVNHGGRGSYESLRLPHAKNSPEHACSALGYAGYLVDENFVALNLTVPRSRYIAGLPVVCIDAAWFQGQCPYAPHQCQHKDSIKHAVTSGKKQDVSCAHCVTMRSEVKADRPAVSEPSGSWLDGMPYAWGARWSEAWQGASKLPKRRTKPRFRQSSCFSEPADP